MTKIFTAVKSVIILAQGVVMRKLLAINLKSLEIGVAITTKSNFKSRYELVITRAPLNWP